MNFKDFSTFKFMITPIFIQIIFWIGVAGAVISGLIMMTAGGAQVLIGFVFMILGPVGWRIYCELLIVIFKIHENLDEINRKK